MSLSSALRNFILFVEEHATLSAIAALAYCGIAAYFCSHITLAKDTRALLADADPVIAEQLDAISAFTGIDRMLVMVEGTRVSREEVTAAARALATRAEEDPIFETAFFEQTYSGVDSILSPLQNSRFLLDPRDVTALLKPEALQERFAVLRATLLGPEGLVRKRQLVADPLETWPAVLKQLDAAPGLSKLEIRDGQLWSKSHNAALVVLTPRGHAMSGSTALQVMGSLNMILEKLQGEYDNIVFRPVGGHRYAFDAEQTVRRDINLAFGLTGVTVLVIFVVFFRRARLLWVALPPLLMGVLTAGGAAGALGMGGVGIHGIVFAFVGATAGLSIDYTIHLVVAARSGADLGNAVGNLAPSLALAAASTAAALVVLGSSDVAAIAHMGLLGGAAIVGALLGNAVWVPLVLPRLLPGDGAPIPRQWSWPGRVARQQRPLVIGTAVLSLALGGAGAWRVSLDGNVRNLNTPSETLAADEAALYAAFGDPGSSALVLARASELSAAATLTEKVRKVLAQDSSRRLLSPAVLAPAPDTAEQRHSAWCANPQTPTHISEAAAAAGFTPQAFDTLAKELSALCASPPSVPLEEGLAAFSALTKQPVRDEAADHVLIASSFEAPAEELDTLRTALENTGDVTVIHRVALNERLVTIIGEEFQRLLVWSLVLVGLLLLIGLRRPSAVALALLPPAAGIVGTLGVLGLLGIPLNLTNLVVFPLIAGLGIDYGVLMATASKENEAERAFSVGVAAATTLAGFGTLAIARYYAIATIGQTLLLAVVLGCLASVLFVPAFRALFQKRSSTR